MAGSHGRAERVTTLARRLATRSASSAFKSGSSHVFTEVSRERGRGHSWISNEKDSLVPPPQVKT